MNHPDWPAFVAAIVAQPGDDALRLVAADFLEENGDADRAAFIRAQVALAQLEASGQGKSLEVDEWRKKERAFLGPLSLSPLWWGSEDCPELVRGTPASSPRFEGGERLIWRRGFIESVRCPAVDWLRHGVAVRKRNPIRDVTLTDLRAVESFDDWHAALASLRGLAEVTLVDCPANSSNWLGMHLPGTRVRVQVRH